MRVAIINTFDKIGGAAKASFRLYLGLLRYGTPTKMIVRTAQSNDLSIIYLKGLLWRFRVAVINRLDELPLKFYPNKESSIFSVGLLSSYSLKRHYEEFDVFNINWVAGAFQSIKSISEIPKPVIITLHDSWAYTGGCHVPFECTKFESGCGLCPQLKSSKEKDLSHFLWKTKKKMWLREDMVVVGGSKWIADNAMKSEIFKNHRIEVIHPGLDLNIFSPRDKSISRNRFNINRNAKVLLFGAVNSTSDKNKGFDLLVKALGYLITKYAQSNLQLIVFGAMSTINELDSSLPILYMGNIDDEKLMTELYCAADVMVVPSLQESFGQTASESMACGTPVVAFDTSGLKDIVDHKVNGFLAEPFNSEELAGGIHWVLSENDNFQLNKAARAKAVKEFDIQHSVRKYMNIFESLSKN